MKGRIANLEAEIQWLRELVIHHRIIDRDELVAALAAIGEEEDEDDEPDPDHTCYYCGQDSCDCDML